MWARFVSKDIIIIVVDVVVVVVAAAGAVVVMLIVGQVGHLLSTDVAGMLLPSVDTLDTAKLNNVTFFKILMIQMLISSWTGNGIG